MNNWKTILFEWLDWSWKSKVIEEMLAKREQFKKLDFYSSWIYSQKDEILAWWKENVVPFFTQVLEDVNQQAIKIIESWDIVLFERSVVTILAYCWTLWIDMTNILKLAWKLLQPEYYFLLDCSFEERKKRILSKEKISKNDREILNDRWRQRQIFNWYIEWFEKIWYLNYYYISTEKVTVVDTVNKIIEIIEKK